MSNIDKQAIDFSLPLETENGEPVKYVCHDVVEYKCARVSVDVETGIVYSSPYVGLKIRNTPLRKIIENASTAYADFENGFISDTTCIDRSHEYLAFVKEPKNLLALLDELEGKDKRLNEILTPNMLLPVIDDMDPDNLRQVIKTASENYSLLHAKCEAAENRAEAAEKRVAELEAMLSRLYAECDTCERRGNGSQSGVAMPSWVTVEAARLLLGVK